MTMGTRGKTDGDEWDAFSRRSRRLLRWRPGQVKRIKRIFSRKQRRRVARQVREEVRAETP
jgi:hypothetical protein